MTEKVTTNDKGQTIGSSELNRLQRAWLQEKDPVKQAKAKEEYFAYVGISNDTEANKSS